MTIQRGNRHLRDATRCLEAARASMMATKRGGRDGINFWNGIDLSDYFLRSVFYIGYLARWRRVCSWGNLILTVHGDNAKA